MNCTLAQQLALSRVWTGEELLRVLGYATEYVMLERSHLNPGLSRKDGIFPADRYNPKESKCDCLIVKNVLREAPEGVAALLPASH